ncbi:phage tail tube protein [Brevibacterium moorei]|uniref:phage tail tube protein n=1 Tax=Brevibacterium moorei TaxID=2968457 RepID=UPI00211C15DD|nr:hypothetical protein [Brevibacterium sp. 68QC2CO]MCQ9385117.1 hypothetical protein [Brevibacterium sp. 68QC2CO]
MAFNDDAVIAISTAHFYTAPPGTPAPTNPNKVDTPWEDVGHTTLEDILSMSTDGGDKTVLGTLQNRNLKTSYAARNVAFNFSIHQFDEAGLKLYLGSNAVIEDGRIGQADNPQPSQLAWYVLIEDGEHCLDFYAPKADIIGADDLDLSDTESLSALPLSVSPLRMAGKKAAWYASGVKDMPKSGS